MCDLHSKYEPKDLISSYKPENICGYVFLLIMMCPLEMAASCKSSTKVAFPLPLHPPSVEVIEVIIWHRQVIFIFKMNVFHDTLFFKWNIIQKYIFH